MLWSAICCPTLNTVRKISIIPRGMAGGVTWFLDEDSIFYSRSKFKALIASALGGRVLRKSFSVKSLPGPAMTYSR